MKNFIICLTLIFAIKSNCLAQVQYNLDESFDDISISNCISLYTYTSSNWVVDKGNPQICRTDNNSFLPTYGTSSNDNVCYLTKHYSSNSYVKNDVIKSTNTFDEESLNSGIYDFQIIYYYLGNTGNPELNVDCNILVKFGTSEYRIPVDKGYSESTPTWKWAKFWVANIHNQQISIELEFTEYEENMYSQIAITQIVVKSGGNPSLPHGPICDSFKPERNQNYHFSCWVKSVIGNDNQSIQDSEYYKDLGIVVSIEFDDSYQNIPPIELQSKGLAIDGWRKVEGEVFLPAEIDYFDIVLSARDLSNSFEGILYDDIRFHPVNANLKTFAYDDASMKLQAELDENNFATFYEYDKEGQLVRIKKETNKGIFTIQESRTSTIKQ